MATPDSELRFQIHPSQDEFLAFGFGVDAGSRSFGREATVFSVVVEQGDEVTELFERSVAAGRWYDARVPLGAFTGKPATLALRTSSFLPQGTGERRSVPAYWSSPRLVSRKRLPTDRPDIFLLTVDTLRPDHLGCYGHSRPTSPAIDGLARDGVIFENAYTTVPRTGPAFASLFTGRYPAGHRVNSMLDELPESQTTLAELLGVAGYRTSADTTLNLPWRKSFDQGFERFDDHHVDPIDRGATVVEGALSWLDRQDLSRPLFQWLHLWDPHFTYDAPLPWRLAEDDGFQGVFDLYERVARGERSWGQVFFENDLDASQVEHAIARYDGEVLYADRMLERFLDALKSSGRYDDALIILTSDHGESLGEHGLHFEHGEYLYDTTLRIPLIVKFPGGRASGRDVAGKRVAVPASILDILPTVAKMAGLDHAAVDGVDLAAQLGAAPRRNRVFFAQTGRSFVAENPRREVEGLEGFWTSIRQGSWKLIHVPTAAGEQLELYDIEADLGETENLISNEPELAARLLRALLTWRQGWLESGYQSLRGEGSLDPQELDRLRALGYAD